MSMQRSTAQGGPRRNVIQDGLVLYLDAANKFSYLRNSVLWNDLSINGNNGTLINGPTFSTDSIGSILFDGIDDYVDSIGTTSTFSFIQNTGVYTISALVRINSLATETHYMGNNDGTTVQKGFYTGYTGTSNQAILLISSGAGGTVLSHTVDNFFTLNSWIFVTCVGNGTSNQFYKNGTAFSTTSNFGSFSTGNSARQLAVGRINNSAINYCWKGNVANVQIYNRALSATEVLQNYNYLKGGYNL